MNETSSESPPVDVEAIIADIRRRQRAAEEQYAAETAPPPGSPTPDEIRAGVAAQSHLYDNLHAANATYRVGALTPRPGLKGRAQQHVYNMIRPLVNELNTFHTHVVRVLNKLVSILDGHDTFTASEMLLKTQRRVDLLTQLCDRLAAYDDMRIEERLRRLEDEAGRRKAGETP